jgi:hypothetical protein
VRPRPAGRSGAIIRILRGDARGTRAHPPRLDSWERRAHDSALRAGSGSRSGKLAGSRVLATVS